MQQPHLTIQELEAKLGESLRLLRLSRNIDQQTLAGRAGVSPRALRNLETGRGSNLSTLLSVVRALGRESWLNTLAPVATINPLTLTLKAKERLRATAPKFKLEAKERLQATAMTATGSPGDLAEKKR